MDNYTYKTSHIPLELKTFIFKLEEDRSAEWNLLQNLFERNQNLLIKEEETFDQWISKIKSWTFGQLVEFVLKKLPDLTPLMCDLTGSYCPLEITNSNHLCDRKISVKLGESIDINVEAKGVPSPKYFWWFLSPTGWKIIEDVEEPTITIDKIQLSDAGTYQCAIKHFPRVVDDNEVEVPEVRSGRIKVVIDPTCILILSHPENKSVKMLDDVEFQCLAETASSMISYQWYYEDTLLFGQNQNTLKLSKVQLDQKGRYKCVAKNLEPGGQMESLESILEVNLPDHDEIIESSLEFENEDIQILQQPSLPHINGQDKASIGDKIHLEVLAACKYKLRYEWVKRIIEKDLLSKSPKVYHDPELVGLGCQLVDEILEHKTVEYQCIISCPTTNKKVLSDPVRVPVCSALKQDKSLPEFKIALLICQEDYDQADFLNLQAPRADGHALIKHLREMEFEVLAFSNLTVGEIHQALELFCRFIDEQTSVFFYFNGHAFAYGSDIYLVGKDTPYPITAIDDQLVWHGIVEQMLDKCSPLFMTMIYDSCRDRLPESVIHQVKHYSRDQLDSNFCVGYGTRQSMKAYVKVESGSSQSLYTKYLLQHIQTRETVGKLFEMLNDSFQLCEDSSISDQMKPEYKVSGQSFSLSAPLRRQTNVSRLQKLFFKQCRFESLIPLMDHDFMSIGLLKSESDSSPAWITGKDSRKPEVVIKLAVRSGNFFNEANLEISAEINDDIDWLSDCYVQVIPVNHRFICSGPREYPKEKDIVFPLCSKRDRFQKSDGPMFSIELDNELIAKENIQVLVIGECLVPALQAVEDSKLKFRIILWFRDKQIPCNAGLLALRVPLCQNMPMLKISNF